MDTVVAPVKPDEQAPFRLYVFLYYPTGENLHWALYLMDRHKLELVIELTRGDNNKWSCKFINKNPIKDPDSDESGFIYGFYDEAIVDAIKQTARGTRVSDHLDKYKSAAFVVDVLDNLIGVEIFGKDKKMKRRFEGWRNYLARNIYDLQKEAGELDSDSDSDEDEY